ncbi:NAD(P)/FAD-dependent oxidoreductase [Nitrogeniibacter aestuarii]|uniref:NAD(P)/FAD-dependent oxidoreductase n=1 Tax=Nitrogeniibacter aestuarii TaxID=2815343 RepID=UPI001D11DA64|nr:FAD-dependent oxidoreductase [Nitrogeniibacter aestuarii]
MTHVIVVGAGQAGAALSARLRQQGFEGQITLIGEEPVAPYQRPPLSKKYLTGELPIDRLYLRPASFYADQNITLMTGCRVERIDRAARWVITPRGPLAYDALVLATGGRARHLPQALGGGLDGVYTVRTLADVDAMAPEFVAGRHLFIVGGGYIGLEAAAVARQRGLTVTVLDASSRILNRVASAQTADYIRARHLAHGVEIIEGETLDHLTGVSRVDGALLSNGRQIPADFAIVGIGLAPATELAEAAGLDVADGITVDALCRTSDPAIYAVGDCASFPHGAGHLRLESVPNAIAMAEAAADAILGHGTPYRPNPWFWSDQYDMSLQIAGLSTGYDRVVSRDSDRGKSFWYFAGARLLAVDAVNDPRAYMLGKRWLEAGLSPNPAHVADASLELKSLGTS